MLLDLTQPGIPSKLLSWWYVSPRSFWSFQGHHTRNNGSFISASLWISPIRNSMKPWEGDRVPYEMCVVTPFFLLLIWNKEFHCMFAYCYCLDCILTFNCQSPISNLVCDVSFAVTFHPANWPRSTCHWENGLQNFTTCVIASLPSLFTSVFL